MKSTVLDVRSDWTPRLLLQRRGFALARQIETVLPEPTTTYTVFETETSQVTRLGRDLIDLDRELRRSARLVAGHQRTFDVLPLPLPVRYGGLNVREVSVKSTESLVQAYGLVHDVLLSNPLQLFLAAQAIRQNAARVRMWFRSRVPGLSRAGLQEIRQILAHGPPGVPREEVGSGAPETSPLEGFERGDPDVRIEGARGDGSALSIELRGHHPSRIRRTRHLREHPDGTEYIEVEEIEW